ncbi:MAG TPA: hypothetical protein DCQ26_12905 [Marinilabiliales bacterium]|nr:hypothetical protein [Marinilabiliales bacterium]HBO75299.1 hypothetical protein [Marinilabiliales bacterium]HBX86551.1 hypothetical protein [Marinilabiliales bacterium]HBY52469.1 hypothetical protein [Marinilabiliales bacterium]HCC30361.1 hypothetical protein [Marinilabiliales bacterium]
MVKETEKLLNGDMDGKWKPENETLTLNHQTYRLSEVDWEAFNQIYPNALWWQAISRFLQKWANASSTITLKTSGSTGTPKLVEVPKKYLQISAIKTCQFFNLDASSTGLLCLSAEYIAGQMMLVRAMVSGMDLICVEPNSNPVLELDQPIDFAAMVPLQVKQSLETPVKLLHVKQIIIGGGTLDAVDSVELSQLPIITYETFGMTETLSHIALKMVAPKKQKFFSTLSGITVSRNGDNQLIIHYPELGIEQLLTNDLVEIINPSTFKWLGRADFVINSGGVKISPESLEEKIAPFISQSFCVIGVPDEKLGEKAILVLEGKSFNTMKLFGQMKQLLPTFHCPKEIRFIENFPLTATGKIQRMELKNKFLAK